MDKSRLYPGEGSEDRKTKNAALYETNPILSDFYCLEYISYERGNLLGSVIWTHYVFRCELSQTDSNL